MSDLFEYWQLLLIPLFFGLGWAAARVDIRQVVHESRALPRSYFQGLNFLLNEQPDKAIDSFLEVAKVDSQTVELHFALGNLFRRRGETDRAIRMHQNLIDRDDLERGRPPACPRRTRAGFPQGRPARPCRGNLQSSLIGTAFEAEAKRNLLEIYQVEKEWQKAIDLARELPDVATPAGGRRVLLRTGCRRDHALAAGGGAYPSRSGDAARTASACAPACCRATCCCRRTAPRPPSPPGSASSSRTPTYLALVAQRLLDAYPQARPARRGHRPAARLSRALSLARPARRGLSAGPRKRGQPRPPIAWCATSCSATRPCSVWRS